MNNISPSLDHWTIIFLIAAAHGFFLAWVIYFHRKGRPSANRILSAIMFIFAVSLVYYVSFWTGYVNLIHQSFGIILLFPLLFGPLFLFYFRLLNGRRFRIADGLHFLTFLLVLLWYSPIYFGLDTSYLSQHITDIIYGRTAMLTRVLILNLHVLVYAVWLFIHLRRQEQMNLPGDEITLHKLRWMRKAAYCFLGFNLAFVSYYVLVNTIDFNHLHDYAISACMSFFIYTVGYMGYQQPDLLLAYQNRNPQSEKYARSGLDAEIAEIQAGRLLTYMKEEKLFLEPDLKLDDLAQSLDMSRHHLSQVINEQLGMTFSDFVNSYRVEEAQLHLADPRKRDEKIINIAYDVGFNTKASFYNAFNKVVGISPSEYRRRSLQKVRQYS